MAGHVSGKIIVRDRMEIHAGGKVSGEVHMKTLRLVLEEGAILEGTIQMGSIPEAEVEPGSEGPMEASDEASDRGPEKSAKSRALHRGQPAMPASTKANRNARRYGRPASSPP